MIRRFIEINLDKDGYPIEDKTSTKNYKLFAGGKYICKIKNAINMKKSYLSYKQQKTEMNMPLNINELTLCYTLTLKIAQVVLTTKFTGK